MEGGRMIYKLPECINKETFHYKILPDLSEQYKHLKKGERTEVSLVQTGRIDSNTIPLFVGMLNLLQDKSCNPVYLELAYNPRFLAFLDAIGFFTELYRYGIIEYDQDYIGGFSDYHYNRQNKILPYNPIKKYEDSSEKDRQEIRDVLAEKIRGDLFCTPIFKRETTPIHNDELWNVTLISVTELIVNAMVYSGSMSYTYIQSGISFSNSRKGYLLSIVDVGKGYYSSLGEKIKKEKGYTEAQRNKFYRYAQKIGIDVVGELNFLSIMEALYYSQNQDRNMNIYYL